MGSDARDVFTNSSKDSGPVSSQMCLFSYTRSLQGGCSERLCLEQSLEERRQRKIVSLGLSSGKVTFPGHHFWVLLWPPLVAVRETRCPGNQPAFLAKSRNDGRSQNLRSCGFLAQMPNSSLGQVLTLQAGLWLSPGGASSWDVEATDTGLVAKGPGQNDTESKR